MEDTGGQKGLPISAEPWQDELRAVLTRIESKLDRALSTGGTSGAAARGCSSDSARVEFRDAPPACASTVAAPAEPLPWLAMTIKSAVEQPATRAGSLSRASSRDLSPAPPSSAKSPNPHPPPPPPPPDGFGETETSIVSAMQGSHSKKSVGYAADHPTAPPPPGQPKPPPGPCPLHSTGHSSIYKASGTSSPRSDLSPRHSHRSRRQDQEHDHGRISQTHSHKSGGGGGAGGGGESEHDQSLQRALPPLPASPAAPSHPVGPSSPPQNLWVIPPPPASPPPSARSRKTRKKQQQQHLRIDADASSSSDDDASARPSTPAIVRDGLSGKDRDRERAIPGAVPTNGHAISTQRLLPGNRRADCTDSDIFDMMTDTKSKCSLNNSSALVLAGLASEDDLEPARSKTALSKTGGAATARSETSGQGATPASGLRQSAQVGFHVTRKFMNRSMTAETHLDGLDQEDTGTGRMEQFIRKAGLETHFDYIKNLRDDPFQLWGWEQLHSTYVSAICSVVIAANAVFIGWAAIKTSDHALRGASAPSEDIWLGEVLFAIFFSLELLFRFAVERWLFFVGPEWRWNALDAVLVSMSLADVIVSVDSPTSRQNVSHGRMVRLMRFFRLARMARVVRAIGNLRVVLLAILDSMSSLFGCFVIIAMTQYVFAVLFMSATSDYFADGAPNAESAEILREYFGDFDTTMVTLFGVISGGVDWLQVALPLADVNAGYLVVFVFFVFLMQFGVLNVVVGAFVAAASEIAGKDKDALVKSELAHWENYTQRIRTFFQAADKDKSGTLSWEEFKNHLKDRKIRAYFQTMDLDVAEAGTLFKLLMEGGSDQVPLEKFLQTCHRLKGQAKSIDLKMLIVMVKNLDERLANFMIHTGQSLGSLMDKQSMVGGRDESSYVPSRRSSRAS